MSSFKRSQRKYVKKAYRVRNWRKYEAGLRNRASLTVWIALTDGKLANWDAPRLKSRKPGRQAQVLESRDRDGRHGKHGVWSRVQANGALVHNSRSRATIVLYSLIGTIGRSP